MPDIIPAWSVETLDIMNVNLFRDFIHLLKQE
jgi:hypothetical protein